jgi:hypothetical protein
MNKFILPVMLLLFSGCNTKETSRTKALTQQLVDSNKVHAISSHRVPKNPILNIREAVESINNSELQAKHYKFMCDELMKVDYFYKDKEIVKIVIDFGTVGDVYAREDYYYKSGKLIFVYEFVEGGPACEGCIKTDEYRTYIENNKVIRYMKNKDVSACRKCEFNSSTRHYKLLSLSSPNQIKAVMCPQR